MAQRPRERQGWVRLVYATLVAAALVLFALVIVSLMLEVQRQLEALGRASSDNVQWSLAQLEVETSLFHEALGKPDPKLDDIRQRFDIFLSRFTIFDKSSLFEDLRRQPEFANSLAQYRNFVDSTLPLIDGPDDRLRAEIPSLAQQIEMLRPYARAISMAGIDYFSARADADRLGVAQTLRNVAVLTSMLVIALSVLAYAMFRNSQQSRQQTVQMATMTDRLKTVVESSADAILVIDRDGIASEFNPAAEEMFGYMRDEVIGQSTQMLLLPPESMTASVQLIEDRVIDAQGKLTGKARLELVAMRKNGGRFPAELTIVGTRGTKGEMAVLFLRDISLRQSTEEEMRRARDRALENERAKAEFLAVMSHEMRTPLNGLLGSVEILGSTALTERQKEIVDIIETSGNVLLGHVNAVLDLSSAEAGALRLDAVAFSVEALVAEVVANQSGLAEAAGNRIEIVAASDPVGRIIGDPGRLRQILLNLVGNAVKFTTDGRVTVEIEALPSLAGNPLVEFRVIDSGIGIAEADQERIFEDFVTLDRSYGREVGGTGLGLGITRRLVEAMGGQIGIESEPGEGSVFWVRLPFSPAGTTSVEDGESSVSDKPVPQRVLVIEDNSINRFVLSTLLAESGHEVTEAIDGMEGVALAEKERFDVILMDISMPRLDGMEATRLVRQGGASATARIVAVTAHAMPDELQRYRAAGMDDCLVKPITRGGLSAAIEGRAITAPTDGVSDTPLDRETLTDLVSHLGAETLDGLLIRFVAEGDATIARIDAGAEADQVRRLAHRLSGSASTFGAHQLARHLAKLETLLKQGRPTIWMKDDLRASWAETRVAVQAARSAILPKSA
ncbi:ATP-binding protein [Tabrizicola sp. J26]|uniref:hybrid sensor histidine kinase/response regulator n=1 Tax=Alitabrizicola rongguiensis TaxID=2909234 RepID=UPI001F2DCD8D|nr:ATP-binding protein [Tabrizicola rongguiensis]MCF1709076.1 ATP-binding protein [Tabrizicola rongguiensis]